MLSRLRTRTYTLIPSSSTLTSTKYASNLYITRSYSIDTPPEELQTNVPMLRDNIDMKNISLQVTGGRSSVSGIRATVFGASGRVGKHVVNQLGQIGSQVVVPYRRDGREMNDVRLMGDLGQIVPIPYQIRDKRSIERAIKGSNVVINCLTLKKETRNFSFHDVHVNASHLIARTAAELGVDRFVHLSVANANEHSESGFIKTKWLGEQVVRSFYPEATIIRPSQCYGYGDWFLEMWGKNFSHIQFPKVPRVLNGDQIIQPCNYMDIARATTCAVLDPITTAGKTYSIYGNVRAQYRHFVDRINESIYLHRNNKRVYIDRPIWLYRYPYKINYPWFKNWQKGWDWLRVYTTNWHGYQYEDLLLSETDFYPDYEKDPSLLTLEDLGIECEDYYYWEKKCLYPFYDRFDPSFTRAYNPNVNNTFGGAVPTSFRPSRYGFWMNKHFLQKTGGYNREWWQPDYNEMDFTKHTKGEEYINYSSDIDGRDRLTMMANRGKLN